jgi:hypothetical protein
MLSFLPRNYFRLLALVTHLVSTKSGCKESSEVRFYVHYVHFLFFQFNWQHSVVIRNCYLYC